MSVISYLVTAAVNTLRLVKFTFSNRIENAVLYYVAQTLPRLFYYSQNDAWFHGTRVNVISFASERVAEYSLRRFSRDLQTLNIIICDMFHQFYASRNINMESVDINLQGDTKKRELLKNPTKIVEIQEKKFIDRN